MDFVDTVLLLCQIIIIFFYINGEMQNKIPTLLQAGLKGSGRSAANEYQSPHSSTTAAWHPRLPDTRQTLHGVFSMFSFSSLLLHIFYLERRQEGKQKHPHRYVTLSEGNLWGFICSTPPDHQMEARTEVLVLD